MKTELDKFYGLIDAIKVAMMTTRRPDDHLESRAMANQKRADGADLWFVTAEGTAKLRDIEHDPHINLAYYKPGSYEWVSAAGIASLSRDREKIRELYEPDWMHVSDKRVIPATARPTILESSSSASTSMRRSFSRSTSRSRSSCSIWRRAG
jgi:general stress protein 26